jgi:hypothetical protein
VICGEGEVRTEVEKGEVEGQGEKKKAESH